MRGKEEKETKTPLIAVKVQHTGGTYTFLTLSLSLCECVYVCVCVCVQLTAVRAANTRTRYVN